MNHEDQQQQLLRYAQDLQELLERHNTLEQRHKEFPPTNSTPPASLEYQIFSLGEQQFAMDRMTIREVIRHPLSAAVPLMPALRGVKNGHGHIVPLIDLPLCVVPAPCHAAEGTVALIFEAQRGVTRMELGLMADSIGAVITIPATAIEPLPQSGMSIKRGFMRGMVTVNHESIIILEPSHALTHDDMVMFAEHAVASEM
jgi:chemotaxis signal transduction protein